MLETAAGPIRLSLQSPAANVSSLVHLVPAGTVKGRDGRVFTMKDAKAVIQASREYAGTRKIPIDYDHQIDFAAANGKPAPAAGWITGLQARPDGIWGLVEWTPAGEARIASGEYRYLSPVITHASDGTVIRLLRAALTNNPNLNELKALFSANTDTGNMEQLLIDLRKLLNLPDDADGPAILAAVSGLATAKQSAAHDPSQFVPIGDFEKVLAERNALNQGIARNAAMDHVDIQIRNANMPSYLREWGVALCSVNKPAFDAFIQRTRGFFNQLTAEMLPAFHSTQGDANSLSEEEKAVCRRMGLSAEEFARSKSFIDSAKG